MVATINKLTRTPNTASQTKSGQSATAMLNVSRWSDLSDDATMNALRRAAEIRQTWTEEEVARRKHVGQERRNELSELLTGLNN
ncbi:hypothetical protein OAG71_02475 [bacterium]|nr:hypothetical protein [bacterium]